MHMSKRIPFKPSEKKISFAGPWITDRESRYVADAVKTGWYETFDKYNKKFEQITARYVGKKYALATHCCTHALHLACKICGFGKGDEVIVTDFSWAATAHTIAYTGATPVFVDVDPDTWCISPGAIEKAITKKTKGVMLVHSFGHPARMDEIMKIARKYKLKVIEDAAPALGSLYKGKKVGSFGDVSCFSFQGAKIAAAGEGGILLTDSKAMREKANYWANMGRTDRIQPFWCDEIGFQYTIGGLGAAIAVAQVERINELVANKRKIFKWYWERLKDVPQLKLIKEPDYGRSNYSFPAALLLTDKISRKVFLDTLRALNIHGRAAFPRMSLFPMYKARFSNPEATKVAKYGFNLPGAHNLTEKDVDFVCKVIKHLVR